MDFSQPLIAPAPTSDYRPKFSLGQPHARYQKAQLLKDRVASRYDEAIAFTMPGRDGIMSGPDDNEIFDDTAVIATPEFASRMQSGVMPNFTRWAAIATGVLIQDEDEVKQITEALEEINEYVFELVNSSNFVVEGHEVFLDLSLGTAAIRIDEMGGDNPFNARSVSLRSLSFCVGPDGRPDPIYDTRMIPLNHILTHYPDAQLPNFYGYDPNQDMKVVEVWERDWSEMEKVVYRMSVFLPDYQNAVILTEDHEGAGCCPYIIVRWSKASGEGWGRGPNFNLLPSLRKVNFAEQALLDHTDMAIGGIWTIEDNGVINTDTVRLDPGTLIPVALGSRGLQNVAPGANFQIADFVLENSRMNIRKALYTEQLGAPEGTPMSATEVTQRMAELARAVGSPFARIIFEMVYPCALRFLYIAKRKKLVTLPELNGKELKLTATAPLAQSQRFEDIESLDRYLEMVTARLGQEQATLIIDGDRTARYLGTKFQIPERLLRPKEIVDEAMNTMAQGYAQQAGMNAGGGSDGQQPGQDQTGGA